MMTDDTTEIVGFVGQALAIRRKELYVCSTNMYIFLTHEKLTAGNYFRCGGCRTTDSSCFPRNCHCPPAAPLPPRCGCWPVVVLSYQGRHASLGPPWGVWCWPWQRWGSWRGPQASKLHQTWCPWQFLPTWLWEVDKGWKKSYMNSWNEFKLTGSFSLPAQEWLQALRHHSTGWPRDRECTSPCTWSSSCNLIKYYSQKMCHSWNEFKVCFRYRHLLHWQWPALMQASLQPTSASSESYTTEGNCCQQMKH